MKKGSLVIKVLFKCVSFLAIFLVIGAGLSKLLIPKWVEWDQSDTLYSLPEDSLDVLFVGSSSFYVGFSPAVFWQENGINSYVCGSSVQAPQVTYLKVADALKTQKPKVVVLGTLSLFTNYDVDAHETYVRLGVDPLRLSPEKLAVAANIAQKSESQSVISYLFPLLRYHDRWKEITQEDYFATPNHDIERGRSTYMQNKIQKMDHFYGRMERTGKAAAPNAESLAYYQKAIELCLSQGIEVVLVTAPREDWSTGRYLGVQQLADQYGLTYLDYNFDEMMDAIDLNLDTDFYNEGHLNIQGAYKFSKHVAGYLQQQYALPDRRGEADLAASWEKDADSFYWDLRCFQEDILPNAE